MRKFSTLALIASLVIGASPVAPADQTPISSQQPEALRLKNVELSASGKLRGQYLTTEGLPLANQAVTVKHGKTADRITTDASGRFVVSNIQSGQCVFEVNNTVFACRVWTKGTAPPKSLQSVALVHEQATVRGQSLPNFGNSMARLGALSTAQQVGLGLLVVAGSTIAIVEGVEDGS